MSTIANRFSFLARWFRRGDDTGQTHEAEFDTPATETASASHRGGLLARRREQKSNRQQSIAQLQGAYDEVIDLIGTLKQHMEAQSQRSEKLLNMMEGLPEALKSLPEANRSQSQTLQAIEGHLKQQSQHTDGLTQAIQGLAKAAGNQEHAMGMIQQQLDAGRESREQLHNSFSALSESLENISESNQAGTQLLNRLNDKHEQSDAHMQQLVARNQRQMTLMGVVSWSLAIVALAVAGTVAIWVSQAVASSATQNTANTPVATAGNTDQSAANTGSAANTAAAGVTANTGSTAASPAETASSATPAPTPTAEPISLDAFDLRPAAVGLNMPFDEQVLSVPALDSVSDNGAAQSSTQ